MVLAQQEHVTAVRATRTHLHAGFDHVKGHGKEDGDGPCTEPSTHHLPPSNLSLGVPAIQHLGTHNAHAAA
jgi:hypothetical protein